jgi:type IV pilus assembly protein PilF
MKANNNEDAEKYFRESLKINNKSANSLYYLLTIHLKKGEYMKARAFLQRLEQVVQPSEEILAAGYQVEKGLNHTKLAKNYLTKLKNRFPRSESLKQIQEN